MSQLASPSRQRSQKWQADEVEILKQAVAHQEARGNRISWPLIAKSLRGRTGKQCREKWKSDLAPDVTKDPYTPQEEYILCRAHSIHGNQWSSLTRYLPGRSQNSIKNLMNASLRREERKRQAAASSSKAPPNNGSLLISDLQGPHCPHLSLLGFYCRLLTLQGVSGGGGSSFLGGNLAIQLDLPSILNKAVDLYESLPDGVIPSLESIKTSDDYFDNVAAAVATASVSRQDASTASASMMARTPISRHKTVFKRSKARNADHDDCSDEEEDDFKDEEEDGHADDEDDAACRGGKGLFHHHQEGAEANVKDKIKAPCSLPAPMCLPIDFKGLFHPSSGCLSSFIIEGGAASSFPWEASLPPLSNLTTLQPQPQPKAAASSAQHGVLLTVAPLDIGTCGDSSLHQLGPLSHESTTTHQAGLLSSASLTGVASGFLPLASSGSFHHHLAPSPKQSLWLSSLCCGASRTDWQSEGGLPATARASVAQSMAGILPLTSSLHLLPELYCSNFALDTTNGDYMGSNRQSKTLAAVFSTKAGVHVTKSVVGAKRGRPRKVVSADEEAEEAEELDADAANDDGSMENEESQMRDAAEVLHSLFHSSSSSGGGQPPVNQKVSFKPSKVSTKPSKKPKLSNKKDLEEDREWAEEEEVRHVRGGMRGKARAMEAPDGGEEGDEGDRQARLTAATHLTANHDDGWRWRKYGEKAIKGQVDVMRSYYKCSQPNCVAKKVVQWSVKGGEMEPEYKGVHSHLPPAPHGTHKNVRQQMELDEKEEQAEC